MARIRQIKPDFFMDDELALICSRDARLLFAGLWVIADRRGRLEDRPSKIKAQVFPYDNDITSDIIDKLLNQLAKGQFIIRYSNLAKSLIQIRTFEKHQHCHMKEAESKLPGPENNGSEPFDPDINPVQEPDKPGASMVQERYKNPLSPATSTSSSTSGVLSMENGETQPSVAAGVEVPPKPTREKPEPSEPAIKLAEQLQTAIIARDPQAKCKNQDCLKPWANHIDMLIRIDGRSPPEIAKVIDWCQKPGNFWNGNILSGKKLREKFDTLWAQMGRESSTRQQERQEEQADRVVERLTSGGKHGTKATS